MFKMLRKPFKRFTSKRGDAIITREGVSDAKKASKSCGKKEEILSLTYRKLPPVLNDQNVMPELIGKSGILTQSQILALEMNLPARAVANPWKLVFNTADNGYSLANMYRTLRIYRAPLLIVIEDVKKRVFGAILSCPLAVSSRFYGSGECILYTFCPEFKVFRWTGKNDLFINGMQDGFAVGSEDGKFGLWIDANLHYGRTEAVCTFDNQPLVPGEDFTMKELECWSLG